MAPADGTRGCHSAVTASHVGADISSPRHAAPRCARRNTAEWEEGRWGGGGGVAELCVIPCFFFFFLFQLCPHRSHARSPYLIPSSSSHPPLHAPSAPDAHCTLAAQRHWALGIALLHPENSFLSIPLPYLPVNNLLLPAECRRASTQYKTCDRARRGEQMSHTIAETHLFFFKFKFRA